jgi:hypothetical protein
MSWPPDALWPRLAALWRTHGAPSASAGERATAFEHLKQLQADFDLSDVQVAYIAEYSTLDPSSRIIKRERAENAFEVVLGVLDETGLVLPFEYAVVVAAWILHSYVFNLFIHTPRLLIYSREPGCGKTVLLVCIEALASNPLRISATTPAVIYHRLKTHPRTTLLLDEIEHSTLWDRRDPLVAIIDDGHRQGGHVPRVVNHELVLYPTFAPLALATVIGPGRKEKFPVQVAGRSIALQLVKSFEGRDDIFPDDPRFAPVRAVASKWAETFQRPETISLPKELRVRCGNNWRVLIAIGAALGYGATLRAAAIAVEKASFDPEVRFYEDIYHVFEQRQADGLWASELVQALSEIEDAPWATLTNEVLYDRLYRKGIEYRTVWKAGADGKRRSNRGFYRKQFEPIWRELLGHAETQSNKIIRLPRHKRGTGETHGG